jgi:hypothetical protein
VAVGTWLGVELGAADGLALGISLGCSLGSSVAAKDRSTVLPLRPTACASVAKSSTSPGLLLVLLLVVVVHQCGGTRDSVHALVWIKSARALVRVYTARRSLWSSQWLHKPTSRFSIRTGPPVTTLQASDVVQKAVVSSFKETDWFLESSPLSRQRLVTVVSFTTRLDCHPKMLTESPTRGRAVTSSRSRVTGSTVVVEVSCTSIMSYDDDDNEVAYSGWITSRATT